MSYILLIETATETCCIALALKDKVVAQRLVTKQKAHGGVINVFIKELLQDAGIGFDKLDAIAVSSPSTARRLGCCTARSPSPIPSASMAGCCPTASRSQVRERPASFRSLAARRIAVLYQLTLTKGNGGAIYGNSAGTIRLNGCTLFGNSGLFGGAIYNSNTELYLNQCTLVGNTAYDFGGGICNQQDNSTKTCTLRNCTVSGNSASIGGGLYTQGAIILQQCIVAGNSALTAAFHPDVDVAIGPLTV